MSQVKFYKNTSKYLADVDKTTTQEGEVYFAKDGIGVVNTAGKSPTAVAYKNSSNRLCTASVVTSQNIPIRTLGEASKYFASYKISGFTTPKISYDHISTDIYVNWIKRGTYIIKTYANREFEEEYHTLPTTTIGTAMINIEQDWEPFSGTPTRPIIEDVCVMAPASYSNFAGAVFTYYSTPLVLHKSSSIVKCMIRLRLALPYDICGSWVDSRRYSISNLSKYITDSTYFALVGFDIVLDSSPDTVLEYSTSNTTNNIIDYFRILPFTHNPKSPDYYFRNV